jgi:hypothetical protein
VQPYLVRRLESQVLDAKVEDLLNARSGVEHQGEQRIVATAIG